MCGIFAIINQKEDIFDYQTFCTLGVANDRRGGDSCGVFIDGKVEYGIGDKALFESFFWTSDLLNNTASCKIALGHDRKASPGMAVNLQNAHPIIIEEDVPVAEGEEPRKEIKFVMVHNGTLYNHEELAKKYIPDIDVKNMTDSQIIARLLYYSGFDWLAEYNGGTAFIAVDYREAKPKILIWRGESKKYSTDKTEEEERPLYCNLENGRLVLSSIGSYVAICDGNCYIVPANKVLTYRNGELKIIKSIDRSKAQQNKIYVATGYSAGTNHTYNNAYVSTWIRHIEIDNTYKIDGKPADGPVKLSTYGKVITKFDSPATYEVPHQLYFFNGIALREFKAYQFLLKAWKRSKLSVNEFCIKYTDLVRYFSYDQCYFLGDVLIKTVSPWDADVFTGMYMPLAQARQYQYVKGILTNDYVIGAAEESYNCFKNIPKFDYKTIWKEFIQTITSQEK